MRAESYVSSDPAAACFYSRRSIEQVVGHLYDLMGLPAPYRSDLAARINDAAFKAKVGNGIAQKLNLIRAVGNTAAHEGRPIPPDTALQVLRELFHVVVFAAFRFSTDPDAVPTEKQFDPALAARLPPLSRKEIGALAAKFKAQDEANAQALAERDELAAVKEAEIASLKAQIAEAQAASTTTDDHDYSEAETRRLFIDVLLGEAGWPLDQARDREYPVTGMPNNQGTGFVDYVLWGADGQPLAVVGAKRTTKSPQVGQQQAKLYAECLEARFGRRPVVLCTNGYQHWIWDEVGGYLPREVQGFYTRDELELLVQTRLPLAGAGIDTMIADRPYQTRAVRAVGDSFDRKQREALLVMATGSGKTRRYVDLRRTTSGLNWERFRAKAAAYLREHEHHLALQKLRRNRQLTHDDLESLAQMLLASAGDQQVDITWVQERAGALGLFIRSLVGLDRAAVTEAFAAYLDDTRFSVDQVRFVSMVVDELTANGVMEVGRLFESPYTDRGHVDVIFGDADVEVIADLLREVKTHAVPSEVA